MSYFLSKKYYDNIMDIISSFDIAPNFNYDTTYKNEIEYIKANISASDTKIETLESELNKKIQQLKSTQAAALQLQFNPHFLLNTLNLISMKTIILTKSENEVSRIIAQFAELLQISLDTEHYIIPIEEELNLTDKYLNIEQLRYNNNFNVVWDLNDLDNNLKIIKFSIQPLVENALKHGIYRLPSKSERTIRITTKKKGDYFILSVEDNGNCNNEQIAMMNSIIKNDNAYSLRTKHIGLKNVDSRLHLYYGDSYHCEILRENGFTKVILFFKIY